MRKKKYLKDCSIRTVIRPAYTMHYNTAPGHLPLEVFQALPTAWRPWVRPRTCWRDYIPHLVGMPWDPVGGAEICYVERRLEYLAEHTATMSQR